MQAIEMGSRWELFVDDFLMDRQADVRLALQHPERREAFTFDAPWEDGGAFPASVVALPASGSDADVTHLYYRASVADAEDEEEGIRIALAESRDGGRSFTRPNLGRREFRNSAENNIVSVGFPGCPPVFRDKNPQCKEPERYKGLNSFGGLPYALCSADGITWRLMQDAPLDYPGAFDTVNTAFWDTITGCYRSYTRSWISRELPEGRTRIRCIQSAVSPDFIHWTPPVENVYADGEQDIHLYTNATIPCPGAEHIYLSFPCRFMERRWIRRNEAAAPDDPGCNDALFMASRDGVHWTRYLDAWVRPGLDARNWGQRSNYPTWGIVPSSATEWSMFVSEHYMQGDEPGRLRRLSIRPHGFVSVHADYRGGEFTTKPLTFDGRCLRLNYATSAAGQLQVEIQDVEGTALEGFALEDMDPLFGDEVDGGVTWGSGSDLTALIGRPVRLRCALRDADLFALRFSSRELDVSRGAVIALSPPTYRERATCDEVRVRPAPGIAAIDGDLSEWDWSAAVTVRPPDQFADICHARIALMYDAEALYVAAEVADPTPMVNAVSFDGDLSRSWDTDALQLRLRAVTDGPPAESGADINDIRLWYSTTDRQAGCYVVLGNNADAGRLNPTGVRGAFQLRADGQGYAFEYRLPWTALNSTRAPRAGERLTACLQCHWGTEDGTGQLCGGVEVRVDNAPEIYVPESWGWAVFE